MVTMSDPAFFILGYINADQRAFTGPDKGQNDGF